MSAKVVTNPREYPIMDMENNEILKICAKECAPHTIISFSKGNHRIIILNEAWEDLKHICDYGKRTARNSQEQMFQGLGHIFKDGDNISIVVSNFIVLYPMESGKTYAKMMNKYSSTDFYDRLNVEKDKLIKFKEAFNKMGNEYVINPFVKHKLETTILAHTHPDLGSFFSEPDYKSNIATLDNPCGMIVVDPIREEICGYVGKGKIAGDAEIIVLENIDSQKVDTRSDTSVEVEILSKLKKDGFKGTYKCTENGTKQNIIIKMQKKIDIKV